jgi:hypothetical protein
MLLIRHEQTRPKQENSKSMEEIQNIRNVHYKPASFSQAGFSILVCGGCSEDSQESDFSRNSSERLRVPLQ